MELRSMYAITAWVQYMLDNFATVDEAVAFIDEDTFQVVSDMMPDGSRLATLHLSASDATGDCAIFEYEPTSALDPSSCDRVIDFFRSLCGKGMTVLAVSHDKQFAAGCNHIFNL